MAKLSLNNIAQLAKTLGATPNSLVTTLRSAERYLRYYDVIDPDKLGTSRRVVSAFGTLKKLQKRLLDNVLLPHFTPADSSHGGITGRNIISNVTAHIESSFIYTADIQSFFPSIHHERVNRFFVQNGVSQEVARACTRLCTCNYRLEQGLLTSTFLSDQLLAVVDTRIQAVCDSLDLRYSRFVDDLAISGNFDFRNSGIPKTINTILMEHGFKRRIDKDRFGSRSEGVSITNLRIDKGRPDVQNSYVQKLESQLESAKLLSIGELSNDSFYTEEQIRGRIEFVCWVNPGRRSQFESLYNSIDWKTHAVNASKAGLIVAAKKVVPVKNVRIK